MGDVIVVLDDDERRIHAMAEEIERLAPQTQCVFFDNAPDMLVWLKENLLRARLLCLDHDLGPNRHRRGEAFDPGVGRDVVDFLATCKPSCPVLIHSTNTQAAYGMLFALQEAGWVAERLSPYDDLTWISTIWRERMTMLLAQPR